MNLPRRAAAATGSRLHRRARMFGLLAAGALVLAACAGNEPTDVTVRPISQVLDGDVTVTPDPSGTTAVVEATTAVPVACAVVYGPDEAFGAIAVDDDMRGGAHADHAPRLTGLEPGTEYQYVLQGSDTAGAFYRSDVMTFRTPPAEQASTPGTNVAPSGTVADVSSEFSDAFAVANAIDGDLGTEWSTAGDGDDAWIEIDLGAATEISGFGYRSREMTDGTAIVETYTVTIDGDEQFGPFDAESSTTDVATEGRVIRFDAGTTTGGNTGAVEIEIYAAP